MKKYQSLLFHFKEIDLTLALFNVRSVLDRKLTNQLKIFFFFFEM